MARKKNNLWADQIEVRRRFSRSVNLERDLDQADIVSDYIPTSGSALVVTRVLEALNTPHSNRAFTITGVYGTGKSAGLQALLGYLAPQDRPVHSVAKQKLHDILEDVHSENTSQLPAGRAVAVGQREPLERTILRALRNSFEKSGSGRKPTVLSEIEDLQQQDDSTLAKSRQKVLDYVVQSAKYHNGHLLLVLDELGKNLEYCATNPHLSDLFLLQQLAELPSSPADPAIVVVGVLHQSFAEYGQSLASLQRKEWGKIQGRFEDIAFSESPEQIVRLLAAAINQKEVARNAKYGKNWQTFLRQTLKTDIEGDTLQLLRPLHPLTALLLPNLAVRLAQNDRSVFSFLASAEPFSFGDFIRQNDAQHLFRLHHLYDYIENAWGQAIHSKRGAERWNEIRRIVEDSGVVDQHLLEAVKTVAVLNVVSSNGLLRASRAIVAAALQNEPEVENSNTLLDALANLPIVTYRKRTDEFRLWEGTDFNLEDELGQILDAGSDSLVNELNKGYVLPSILVRRHAFKTGTNRLFEQVYADGSTNLRTLEVQSTQSDGLILRWLGQQSDGIPATTPKGYPIVCIVGSETIALQAAVKELQALRHIEKSNEKLVRDSVARREVAERIAATESLVSETMRQTFDPKKIVITSGAESTTLQSEAELQGYLAGICDQVYCHSLPVQNELLNRRDLSSQAAAGRRMLIEHILANGNEERLGIKGFGPEYAMYASMVERLGFHQTVGGQPKLVEPTDKELPGWTAIVGRMRELQGEPISVADLERILHAPPFGLKNGIIPVVLALLSVLHRDSISMYRDGTFIPEFAAEHFEVMIKRPQKFALRWFEVDDSRREVLVALSRILIAGEPATTLLAAAKPLIGFVRQLPDYTKRTRNMGSLARSALDVIIEANDAEELLLDLLPRSLDQEPLRTGTVTTDRANRYAEALREVIVEWNECFGKLLSRCTKELSEALNTSSDLPAMWSELRQRAQRLQNRSLDRSISGLVNALGSEAKTTPEDWLESVMLVLADANPRSWTADNVTRFKDELALKSRAFLDLESVHASGGGNLKLLSFTDNAGNMVRSVFSLNEQDRQRAKADARAILDAHAGENRAYLQTLLLELVSEVARLGTSETSGNDKPSDDQGVA